MKIQKKFHKTLKNLNLSDMQPGQFLVNKDGRKCKVLGVCGEAIFTSKTENFDESDSSICTLAELKKFGWSLLEEPWVPKDSDRIFVVNALGGIPVAFTWDEFSEEAQDFLLKTGNYGRTYQDAELYKQKLIERMGKK